MFSDYFTQWIHQKDERSSHSGGDFVVRTLYVKNPIVSSIVSRNTKKKQILIYIFNGLKSLNMILSV